MSKDAIAEYCSLFNSARSVDEAFEGLTAVAYDLGFDAVGYLYSPNRFSDDRPMALPPIHRMTRRDAELDHLYVEKKLFQADPVFYSCRKATLPVHWSFNNSPSDCGALTSRLRNRQQELMELVVHFGFSDGLAVPVHLPAGGLAMVSLLSRRCSSSAGSDQYMREKLAFIVAHRFQDAIGRVVGRPMTPGKRDELTERELECLTWVANGKTASETGAILGIEEVTVRFHLGNAKLKLGAMNTLHAVAKAAITGRLGTPH